MWEHLEEGRTTVEVAERFADGEAGEDERRGVPICWAYEERPAGVALNAAAYTVLASGEAALEGAKAAALLFAPSAAPGWIDAARQDVVGPEGATIDPA